MRSNILLLLIFLIPFLINSNDFFGGGSYSSFPRKGSSGDDGYYKLLGIQKSASTNEIKSAYRKKAMKLHPDRGGTEKEFKALAEAYEVLIDPKKREVYDKFGKDGASIGSSESNPFQRGAFTRDLFREFRSFSIPLMFRLDVTLEDCFNGKKLNVQLNDLLLPIQIQPGMKNGQQILLKNQYVDGRGGAPKDLVFALNEIRHPKFQRKNSDLLLDMTITLSEALLGFQKRLLLLNDEIVNIAVGVLGQQNRRGKEKKEKIPATDSSEVIGDGDVWVLKGFGMPVFGNPTKRGDMFIHFKVKFPSRFPSSILNPNPHNPTSSTDSYSYSPSLSSMNIHREEINSPKQRDDFSIFQEVLKKIEGKSIADSSSFSSPLPSPNHPFLTLEKSNLNYFGLSQKQDSDNQRGGGGGGGRSFFSFQQDDGDEESEEGDLNWSDPFGSFHPLGGFFFR